MGLRNKVGVIVLGTLFLGVLLSCSEKHAGGNSAETGNPEFAGVLQLADGRPASYARVQCLPESFNPTTDSVATQWKTKTDSNGAFVFDSMDLEYCNLEAAHDSSGFQVLLHHLDIPKSNVLNVQAILSATGSIRIGVDSTLEGVKGVVGIRGTSILREVQVKFATLFIDSLPAALLDSIFFYPENHESGIPLAAAVQVMSGDTVLVDAVPIRYSLEKVLNTASSFVALKDTLFGFPYAWRLDSSDLDFFMIHPQDGKLSIYRGNIEVGYQIANWDVANKTALIWVRLDTLLPNTKEQKLRLEYTEWDTSPIANAIPPFAGRDSTVAVWHFEENGDTSYDDGPHHLFGLNSGLIHQDAKVGKGFYYGGKNAFITIPGSEQGLLNLPYENQTTFSVWARLDAANTSRFVFGKGEFQYYLKYQYSSGWLFENNDEETVTQYHRSQAPFDSISDLKKWQHLAVVMRAGKDAKLYLNGDLIDSLANYNSRLELRDIAQPFQIGCRINSDSTRDQFFMGMIDELMVWNVSQSDEWIRMLYVNQKGLF